MPVLHTSCHSDLVPYLLWDFSWSSIHPSLETVQPQEGRGLISLYTNQCVGYNCFLAACCNRQGDMQSYRTSATRENVRESSGWRYTNA